jgi:hypothetical protein
MSKNTPNGFEGIAAKTTKILAFIMIGIYGGLLIVICCVAAIKTGDDGKVWTDLFKSGFLILGGGLTTIIGYYFGSRGTQEAQEVAEIA